MPGLQDPVLCGSGEQTKGFVHARKAIYHLSDSLSLCLFSHLFFDAGSPFTPETGFELATQPRELQTHHPPTSFLLDTGITDVHHHQVFMNELLI